MLFATTGASGSAGDTVEIVAADGTVVASFEATKQFGSVVYSSAEVAGGASYTVTVNGSTAAAVIAGSAHREDRSMPVHRSRIPDRHAMRCARSPSRRDHGPAPRSR